MIFCFCFLPYSTEYVLKKSNFATSFMNEIREKLLNLIQAGQIENTNSQIGHELRQLLFLLEKTQNFSNDDFEKIENLFFTLIESEKIRLSSIVASFVGIGIVLLCQNHKISHWNFVSIIDKMVRKESVSAIVVLGIVTKHSIEGFKSQLPSIIEIMLNIQTSLVQPLVCQCFRRIIKGTGTFLTKSINDIHSYITKKLSSNNNMLRLECIKTIPALYSYAKLSLDSILVLFRLIINDSNVSNSETLKFACAKSLANVAFWGCNDNLKEKLDKRENPFSFLHNFFSSLAPKDAGIQTISYSFVIFLRYFQPLFIIENLRFLISFVIEFSTLKYISLPSLSLLTYSLFDSIIHNTGDTISSSICKHVYEKIKEKPLTGSSATVILTVLNHFWVFPSSKAASSYAKYIYPLLSTTRPDVRRLASSFFAVLAIKEPYTSAAYFKYFFEVFSNFAKASEHEMDGFSRALVFNILLFQNSSRKIKDFDVNQLYKNIQNASFSILAQESGVKTQTSYAFLVLSALQKKKLLSEETILQILPNIEKCFKFPKEMKFASIFLLQVLLTSNINFETSNNNEFTNKLKDIIMKYIQGYISNYSIYSTPTHLAFFKIAKLSQFAWKQNPNLPFSIAEISLFLVNKYITPEILEIIHPFTGQIDQIYELYGVKSPVMTLAMSKSKANSFAYIDSEATTIYKELLDNTYYSNKINFIKEIENSFSTWVFLAISNSRSNANLINSLFLQTKENYCAKLLLIRSLLSREKLKSFLPSNGLPFLLNIESVNNRIIQRNGAICVARWIKIYPELIDPCLNYLEKPTRSPQFVCNIFTEIARNISIDSNLTKIINILNNISKTHSLMYPVMSFTALMKYNKLKNDQLASTVSLLEKSAFNESLRNPTTLVFYKSFFSRLKKINPDIIFSLLNFPIFRNYASLQGYEMLKYVQKPCEMSMMKSIFCSSNLPQNILVQKIKYLKTIDDVPTMLTLLQQTNLVSVSESILKAVDTYSDMKYWTDICKRIVINKCVPPAERKGDSRVNPTKTVLIVAMKIVVKLVHKIRELFPLELNSIDDIISIAFNAIQIKDKNIDYHSFEILAVILKAFIDVRNKDGALLNTYLSQFHPMLNHALDGTRSLGSVVHFCIAYLNFLAESNNSLFQEAITVCEKCLKKIEATLPSSFEKDDNIEPLIIYCRISSRIIILISSSNVSYHMNNFNKFSTILIHLLFQNKVRVNNLEDELPDFIASNIKSLTDELKHALLLLLLSELSKDKCKVYVLNALIILIDNVTISNEILEFLIKSVSRKKNSFNVISKTENTQKNLFENEDSLDIDEYWITKKENKSGFPYFLTKIASLIPKDSQYNELWTYIFSMSIESPVCYPALSILFTKCQKNNQSLVINSLPLIINNENAYPLFVQLFETFDSLTPEIMDKILKLIVHSDSPNRFEIIKLGIAKFGEYNLSCIEDISELIQDHSVIIPNGINFVASLLIDKSTVKFGLNLLQKGVADAVIFGLTKSLKSLPRILHFLYLSLIKLKEYIEPSETKQFESVLVSIVFLCLKLTKDQKERKAVLSPITMILKNIDKSILKQKWDEESRKADILKALTPPQTRKIETIELKTFGIIKPTSTSRWQTLEIGD